MTDSQDFKVTSTWSGDLAVADAPPAPSMPHKPAARLATMPAWLLGAIALINWSLTQAVEFLAIQPLRDIRTAIAPVSFVTLIRGGQWQLNTRCSSPS